MDRREEKLVLVTEKVAPSGSGTSAQLTWGLISLLKRETGNLFAFCCLQMLKMLKVEIDQAVRKDTQLRYQRQEAKDKSTPTWVD